MNLGLDDHYVFVEPLRHAFGIMGFIRDIANGDGNVVFGEKLFGLVLVNIHNRGITYFGLTTTFPAAAPHEGPWPNALIVMISGKPVPYDRFMSWAGAKCTIEPP